MDLRKPIRLNLQRPIRMNLRNPIRMNLWRPIRMDLRRPIKKKNQMKPPRSACIMAGETSGRYRFGVVSFGYRQEVLHLSQNDRENTHAERCGY